MRSELAFCHHTPNFNPPLSKKVRLWSQLLRARFVRREPGLGAVLSPDSLDLPLGMMPGPLLRWEAKIYRPQLY